ncbi:MAG: 30S ribosomal protein S6 [Candidatus Zixiibacteriota bacterium]
MRLYETVFVLDPSLDEHAVEKERAKVEELITSRKGTVKKIDKWGMKKFAYPIKKRPQGYYTLVYFEGDGSLLEELERAYKLNESCLRYLTVASEEEMTEREGDETGEDQTASTSPP